MANNKTTSTFINSALLLSVAGGFNALASDEPKTLETTKADGTKQDSYKIEKSSSVKLTQPIARTPKTINVVSSDLIEDQGITSLEDALRNVAGVSTFGGGEGGGGVVTTTDAVTIRGFDARTSIFVDGMRDIAGYNRDLFNYEQVEVIKGASGSLDGRSTGGGSVNLSTKQAKMDSFMTVTGLLDSFDTTRATLDVNRQVSDNLAGRVNFVYTDGGDVLGNDVENYQTTAGAASLLFELSDNTRFNFDALVMTQDNTPVLGIPYITETQAGAFVPGSATVTNDNGTPDDDSDDFDEIITSPADPREVGAFGTGGTGLAEGPLPESMWDNYYGIPGRDYEKVDLTLFTFGVDHKFSDSFSVRNRTRFGSNERDTVVGRPVIKNSYDGETGVRRGRNYAFGLVDLGRLQGVDEEFELFVSQTDFSLELQGDDISQDIVFGVEFATESRLSRHTDHFGAFRGRTHFTYLIDGVETTAPSVSIINPTQDISFTGSLPRNPEKDEDTEATITAFYAFDSIKFAEAFQLDLNARYEQFKLEGSRCPRSSTCELETGLKVEDNLMSYGAALSYFPSEYGSLYLSYSNSEEPIGVNLDIQGADRNSLEPQEAESMELGSKWRFFDDSLLVSAAMYQTTKTVLDFNGAREPFIGGEQQVKGFEISAVGQVSDALALHFNYAKLDTEITEDFNEDTEGNGLQSSPDDTINFWANYTLLDNDLSIGGGLTYSSGETFWRRSTAYFETGSHTELWLMTKYQVSDAFSVQLNVDNLTDERYVTDYSAWGHFRPNNGRNFKLQATYSF